MKYLIGAAIGLIFITQCYIMDANKVRTRATLKNRELIKEGIVNDSFFQIKLDSILEFKRKEHGDG